MPKVIKIDKPEDCNGCEMCVFEIQRQLEKVGLEGSLIRILTKHDNGYEYPVFTPDVDPRTNTINIERIKKICPKMVFEIEEEIK
ncbi:MAG TPA: hypothetical protein PKK07_02040 [bacterium]|jgi:hypothetical protein|nr:hypothetical protein [bacterium]HOA18467.1 hypothetical protein [bacterium]